MFSAIAYKRLTAVDLPGIASHQHELNGVSALRDFFGGGEKTQGEIQWSYFADGQTVREARSKFTFYDARAKSAALTGRSEWRFYYEGNFLSCSGLGDLLILGLTTSRQMVGLVFQKNSSFSETAEIIFGLKGSVRERFDAGFPLNVAQIEARMMGKEEIRGVAQLILSNVR